MPGHLWASTAKLSLLLVVLPVVCLAQMPPIDSQQYAAKVETLTGDVSVLKDSQPWALEVGDSVQVKQLILSGVDGHAMFRVSDGSTFEVFPNSQVVFRSAAPNWMELLDVLVVTPAAVISVRGTVFDVLVEDENSTTVIQDEEGQVEVQHRLLPGTPKVLNPGESLRVYKSQPIASSVIDKGTIWRQALRMILDAATTYETRMPRGVGIPNSSGDTKPNIPAPPPAPPAPPPIP
jgi:ferric-dicitrate binding protein FerR (iron transport regulator)